VPLCGSGILFASSGLLILIVAVISWRRVERLRTRGIRARGRVIDVVRDEEPIDSAESSAHPGEMRVVYYRVIEFTTANGSSHRFRDTAGYSTTPTVGLPIDVVYDPDNPSVAEVDRGRRMYFVPVVLSGVGTLWIALTLFGPSLDVIAPFCR
jgi:hypothetical protein